MMPGTDAKPAMANNPFIAIELDDLEVGQVLPGHLRDRDGRIIIPAGAVLTEEDIAGLKDRSLFVGQDWLDNRARMRAAQAAAREGEPAGSYHLPFDLPTGAELRQQQRHVWNTVLNLEITDADGSSRRTMSVRTLNLSSGGFAFLMRQFVHPGSRVLAEFKALPGKPVVEAIVRSCTPLGGMEHRVGVQFIGEPARPARAAEFGSDAA